MGGVRKAKLGRKRKGQMMERQRVPDRTQTDYFVWVVDGLPTAYCLLRRRRRRAWLSMARALELRCACKSNFCARRQEARRQGSKEVGYCLIRQLERRKAG